MSKNIIKIEYYDINTQLWTDIPFLRPINRKKTEDGTLDIGLFSSRKSLVSDEIETFTKLRFQTKNLDYINWRIDTDSAEQLTFAPKTEYWKHNFTLIEPTKILERRLVRGFSLKQPLTGTQKYLDETIDLLLIKHKTLIDGETPEFVLDTVVRNRINTIISPEFTFNDLTLRQCLDIILSYAKAITRVKEYGIISADFLEDFTEVSDFGTLINSRIKEQTSENYCDALVTNLSNIVSEGAGETETTVIYPFENGWITPRAEEGKTEISDNSAEIVVNYPIYKIKKVIMDCQETLCTTEIDITDYVFEEKQYLALPDEFDATNIYRGSALYWKQGSNRIQGLTHQTPVWWGLGSNLEAIRVIYKRARGIDSVDFIKDFKFRIEYIPLTEEFAKTRRLDNEGFNTESETVYNQTEKVINTDSFGENIKGAIAQLGNRTIMETYNIKEFDNIPDIGNLINGLYVNNIEIEDWENFSKATLELTENYSKLKDIVATNKEYRISDVPFENLVQEQLYIEDYCVIDFDDNGDNTSFVQPDAIDAYAKTFETYSQSDDLLASSSIFTYPAEASPSFEDEYLIGTIARPYGNSLLFTQKMADNVSAGRGKVFQTPSMSAGFASDLDVIYIEPNDISADKNLISVRIGNSYTGGFLGIDALAKLIPAQDFQNELNSTYFNIEKMVNEKDSGGIIAMTYQLHTKRKNNAIKVGSNFIKNNPLVNLSNSNDIKVYGLDFEPKEFLNKIDVGSFDILASSINVDLLLDDSLETRGFKLYANYDTTPRGLDYQSYCFADSVTGEVLLTINRQVFQAFSKTDDIYFNFKNKL